MRKRCEHEAKFRYCSKAVFMKFVFLKIENVRKPVESSNRIRVGEGSPKEERILEAFHGNKSKIGDERNSDATNKKNA